MSPDSSPIAELPEFDVMVRMLSATGIVHSPSELHGVICGLLATGQGRDTPSLLGTLAAHVEQPAGLPEPLSAALIDCRDAALSGFAGTGLDLALLLPSSDEELGLRVAALAQWCEGFLVGFGTGAAGISDSALSPGIQEALSDLAAISQVETPEGEGDEQEQLLEEVTEHCRMSALMIYTDLVMKPASAKAQKTQSSGTPTRH